MNVKVIGSTDSFWGDTNDLAWVERWRGRIAPSALPGEEGEPIGFFVECAGNARLAIDGQPVIDGVSGAAREGRLRPATAGPLPLDGMLDELRFSDVDRYGTDEFTPASFSRNYGATPPAPARPTGPPLLFEGTLRGDVLPIGSRKHVFIDDVLVEASQGVHLVSHPPSLRPEDVSGVADVPMGSYDRDGQTIQFIGTGRPPTRPGSTTWDGRMFEDPAVPPQAEDRFKYAGRDVQRGIYLFVSPDGVHWRRNETIMLPFDPDGDDEIRATELATSRDGMHWRLFGKPFFDDIGWELEPGFQVTEALSADALVRRGDELWTYASLREDPHRGTGGRSRIVSYVRRLDGFTSLQARDKPGWLRTRPFTFLGDRLELNVAARGAVRIGLLDEAGDEIPGFTLQDCDPIQADAMRQAVSWRGSADVSRLAGRPVRLRMEMQDSDRFAFQSVPGM